METNELYPASPEGARPRTEVTLTYRLRVALVLLSLTLFLGLYLGLVAATGYGLYWLVTTEEKTGFWGFMLGLGGLMLFFFLVKGIFRRSPESKDGRIRVTEAEQPKLFAFVRRLCAEAKGPFPDGIYLSHDVNAAVFYRRSFLSLFLPQRKSLLIGLGLVNVLNVSELKAVLAHEFGHFAQSSLKLGQYVYTANQVIRDMVVARDFWDEALARWRTIDLRLSFPAWLLTGVVWVIRKVLTLLFKLVNFANLSLSRQMEFDADLHAVSLTGSDALVSGLWKTERAGLAMEGAWASLSSLVGYRKFTADIFHHQRAELGRLDEMLAKEKEPTPFVLSLREPYRYGADLHFQAGDDHAPSMWSTHPSNREREANAKRDYVALAPVEAPAWELFEHRKGLKKKLTLAGYELRLGREVSPRDCLPPKEVAAILREDQEEQEQAEHYHGLYESRFVEPGDIEALAREVDALSAEELEALSARAREWAGDPLSAFMSALRRAEEDEQTLTAAKDAEEPSFTLRGATHGRSKARKMLEETQGRIKALRDRLGEADRILFQHFYARSAGDPEAREELQGRYRFLGAVEDHIRELNGAEAIFGGAMKMLEGGTELQEVEFRQLKGGLDEVHTRLARALLRARKQRVPRLSHIADGTRVRDYVLDGDLVDPLPSDRIEGKSIAELGRQLGLVLSRMRRLHFKNLGALLHLQEKLDPELYGLGAEAPPAEETAPAEDD